MVADYTAGEAGQDRSQSRPPWPVRHIPACRGGGAEETVPVNSSSFQNLVPWIVVWSARPFRCFN